MPSAVTRPDGYDTVSLCGTYNRSRLGVTQFVIVRSRIASLFGYSLESSPSARELFLLWRTLLVLSVNVFGACQRWVR